MAPSHLQIDELAGVLSGGGVRAQEEAARRLGEIGSPRAMMVLYEFVRNEEANADARKVAAEELLRLGLLRRERSGPSLSFIWLAAMAAVVVVVGAATILGPAGGVAFAAAAVGLGVIALRGRDDVGAEHVYLGPEGERFRFAPDLRGNAGGTAWSDGFGDAGGGGGNGGGL
jgi:hypothetical protein